MEHMIGFNKIEDNNDRWLEVNFEKCHLKSDLKKFVGCNIKESHIKKSRIFLGRCDCVWACWESIADVI